jgi:hypothetical protein
LSRNPWLSLSWPAIGYVMSMLDGLIKLVIIGKLRIVCNVCIYLLDQCPQ